MSIKFVNTPSLEGMDAQITPVVGENPLCRIPSVRALYTAVSRQELMSQKPGTVQGFVLAFEEGLKNIVFANLDCRHDHFKLVNTVAEAVRTAVEMHSKNIFVPVGTDFSDEEVSLICQGLMIGAYHFDLYKSEKSPRVRFTLYSERDYSAAVQNGKMLGECTNLARDLVNTPGSDMTPAILAQKAAAQAELCGVKYEILNEYDIEKLGMGSFLAVARGSANPPRLIVLRYQGDPESDSTVALVGKGITFDTGGYDIKDDESMATMKSDMGGAAAVIGALLAIARSGIKANVTAVVAACENRVSGNAYLPGDVLRTMSGKTVEVINTDAEGRLTLIDAVTYAVQKENAFAVIDIATLTGGQVVSLGYRYSALISDSKVLTEMIQKASAACGEKVWQMPADEIFLEPLKTSTIADYRHIGSKGGGTISAGLLIREFAEGRHFAHLDIAGPAYLESELPGWETGATGYGVRLLYQTLRLLAE